MTTLKSLLNIFKPKVANAVILDSTNLMSLFENSTEFFCVFDKEMNYLYVNKAHVKLLGGINYTGKNLYEVFPSMKSPKVFEMMDKVLKKGETVFIENGQFSNGEKNLFVNVTYVPRRDAQGVIIGISTLGTDETEKVNSIQQVENLATELKSSISSRDTFFGIASHELKTPLTALKLQMQLQLKVLKMEGVEVFTSTMLEGIFTKTISQADKLTRLVDDMLDVSRITAEKLNMEFKEKNFSKLVRDTVESYHFQFQNSGMDLTLEIEKEFIFSIDEVRMEQVLTNLINNAIKYAPHAPIKIKLYSEDNVILLQIRDHGPGIAEDRQSKIFDRFETGISSSNVGGLGLGLFISKKIIEHHNGAITLESKEGAGSEFTIILPLP